MYKIFVGDKPIVLTTLVEAETDFKNYSLKKANMAKVIRKLRKKSIREVRLIHKNPKKLLKKFLKKLPNVVAGGGKVYNTNGDILFIYRNDKWDLPKGKAEKKETIEQTALREVEEETGVNGLEIIKALDTTYHVFKRNGTYRIKVTYWFEMQTAYAGELLAQANEGITKVAWLGKNESQEALNNSYPNIRLLV